MSTTPNRHIPLMEPSQAQPEVVYNAAMEILDVAESLEVEQSGDSPGARGVTKIKFLGSTVTDEGGGVVLVTADSVSGGGGSLELTDGSHDLTGVTKITVSGAVVGGTAGAATLTISGGGGGGSENVTPDSHPASADAMDDEFEGTSLDAKWTWYHQNTASVAFEAGAVKFTATINASEDVGMIGQPLPGGGAWRFRAKLSALTQASVNNAGLYLHETGTGKILQFGLLDLSGTGTIWVETASSFTGSGSIATSGAALLWPLGLNYPSTPAYFEIELASGTLHFRLSNTGYDGTFVEFYSVAQTTPFTTAPNVIGLGGYSFNGSTPVRLYCDWFRRMA